MKIKIPKSLRGFAYDRVMPVDMNNFDVDILLPALFFKVVTGGKGIGRMANDPTDIVKYVSSLAQHDALRGFQGTNERRLLDRLVRTSLVQIGRQGIAKKVEQIDALSGHTLLAFKPGLPSKNSRLRRVDALLYRMLERQLRGDQSVRALFIEIFGKGIQLQGGPEPDGWYDGQTPVDTLTRLSMAFIDGFKTTGISKAKVRDVFHATPGLSERIARDLSRYLLAYHDRMPVEALTYHFKALINLELFAFTVKLLHGIIALVADPEELPPSLAARFEPSPPYLYLDFTEQTNGLSREMSRACVRRDLETINQFVVANLTLRQLDRYLQRLSRDRRVGAIVTGALQPEGPGYLQAMLLLRDNDLVGPRLDAAAENDEEEIRRENAADPLEEGELPGADEDIDRVTAGAGSSLEALVLLLAEGQRATTVAHVGNWYRSVAGLTKPYGVLSGHATSRQSWRYAPSNDLLATLVQLAAVDIPKWNHEAPRPQPITLRAFLDWLEERFGFLVDRPPEGFAGADAVAAAQGNVRAMLRRLRQMGIFRDLSDDFTVQRLTPPYADDEGKVIA